MPGSLVLVARVVAPVLYAGAGYFSARQSVAAPRYVVMSPALTGRGDGMHCGCISACHLSCSLMALTNMQTPGILYL